MRRAVGLVPIAVDDLREVSLGDWEGLTVETVVERYGDHYWRWLAAPGDHAPPGGEPMAALKMRVTAAVGAIQARHPAGRVLVVTRGGVVATYLGGRLALGLDAVRRLRVENASITRIELPAARLLSLNDTAHLAETVARMGAP